MKDPFNSFRNSGSVQLDDKQTATQELIDPKVEASDNILTTVKREEWYKVSGIYHVVLRTGVRSEEEGVWRLEIHNVAVWDEWICN
jgi:hypothetical protein